MRCLRSPKPGRHRLFLSQFPFQQTPLYYYLYHLLGRHIRTFSRQVEIMLYS